MQNNPAYAQTMLQITAVTKLYTNSNGNVTAVTGSGTIFSRSFNGVATNTAYQTTEESLLYDYSNSYPNKTDFTSDFILKEYEIPMTKSYTLNKLYKNIPNKITSQSSLKDASGNLVSSTNFTANFILAYNNYNYLSEVNNPSISLNSELIYNK